MARLQYLLKIRPREGAIALRLLAMMLVAWSGFAVGGNAVESLFFVRFGPAFLPYLFVALGAVTFAAMLGLNALLGVSRPLRLLVFAPLVLAVLVVAMRLLLLFDWRWLYPVMWLAMMVMWTILGVAAWGVAGAIHDTRQVKRLFPLYGSGLILGTAVGGLATGPLARWLGTENLLILWAVSLLSMFLLARSAVGVAGAIVATRRRRRRPSGLVKAQLAGGARFVRASPLLSSMALALAWLALVYFSLSFLFARAATARFPDADRLAGFLGLFMGVTNGTALLLSLVAANRLFARFGVATMVVVLAFVYLAGFAVLGVWMSFVVVLAFRFVQMVWINGVWGSAWQALYNVIAPEHRDRTRAFMDGAALQAGIVAAGALLILAERALEPRAVAFIGLVAAGLATLTAMRVRRAYAGAAVAALRAGNPEVFLTEEEPFGGVRQDGAALSAVTRGVSDPDPAVRRISVEILAEVADSEAIPTLLDGLHDPDPVVRAAALRGIGRIGEESLLVEASRLLSDGDAEVRLASLESVVAIGSPQHVAGLRSLLADGDPRVRARAAAALLGSDYGDEAERTLEAMVRSTEAEWRAAAVAALHRSGAHEETVVSGLADPDPVVRRATVSALWTDPPARAAESLVEALGDPDPDVRRGAAECLVRIGNQARGPLMEALTRPDLEAGAIHVLDQMEGVDPKILQSYIRREVSGAVRYGDLLRIVAQENDGRMDLLARSLRGRSFQHGVNALHAASRFTDRSAIELAIENLGSRDPAQRANAVETLDAAGEPEVVRPLLGVWEGTGRPVKGGGTSALADLMLDVDPWLRACAAFAAARHRELRAAVERLARADEDTLVREAATAALEGHTAMETLPSLSLMERVMFLGRVPLFVDLSPPDLKQVAEIAAEHVYPDGDVIAEQGEPADEMYVVVSGEIRVRVSRDGGVSADVATRSPGDAVGEMAIVSGAPRMASLVAAGDVRILAIDRRRFERILRDRPDASLAVMRVLCERLREAHGAEPVEARA